MLRRDDNSMNLLQKLKYKLIIRIVIFILIGVVVYTFEYMTSPNYSENDIYEINGICVDVYEKGSSGRTSKKYIAMDNGNVYYIHKYHLNGIIGGIHALEGKELKFWASDKSIWWFQDHTLVAWGETSAIKEETLAKSNRDNRINRISGVVIYIVIGSAFIIPPILQLSVQYDINQKAVCSENRKKAKR